MVDRVRLDTILQENRAVQNAPSSFLGLLKQYLRQVDMGQLKADKMIEQFLRGKRDVYEVVLSLEKADIEFRLFMKIRDKLIQAYEEIMRMQI